VAVRRRETVEQQKERFGVTEVWQLNYAKAIEQLHDALEETYELLEPIPIEESRGLLLRVDSVCADADTLSDTFVDAMDLYEQGEHGFDFSEEMDKELMFYNINSGYYDDFLNHLYLESEDEDSDLNFELEEMIILFRRAFSELLSAQGLQ